MSQSHEPSYYEIALTNRQVLTVFVVLLVCVVAAFFSGVWIGRRGTLPAGQEQVAELVPADEAGEAGGEPVQDLRFFSEEPDPPDAGRRPAVATEPQPDTTPRKDRAGQAARPPIQSPPAEEASQAAAPGPAPPATMPATEPPASAPASRPEPDQVAVNDPTVEAGTGPVGAPEAGAEPVSGDVVIQVFFSSDEEKAQALVERLGGSGYPAFLSPVRVGVQTMFRVRVGPYSERAEAEAIASKVQRAFKLDTWITQ